MNRKAKEQKVLKEDGKVFEIHNLSIDVRYRNRNYRLSDPVTTAITGTGRLSVFELEPISGTGPSFVARWDGGSRDEGKTERADLDIDIEGVSESQRRRFKSELDGYCGHHSKRVPSNTQRAYDVSICTRNEGRIFEARVCFGVRRKLAFDASLGPFAATLENP